MRILIIRDGSGWGGVYGRCLFDTKEKVCINLDSCFKITKDPIYLQIESINLPLSKFSKKAILPFTSDISLLEFFLPDCDLEHANYMCFDQQIDYVYILKSDNKVQCVLNTDEGYWPKNPTLNAKLNKLIELVH